MRRILVVDGDMACRTAIGVMLSTRGFDVRTADGPDDALDMAHTFAPHIVVVDSRAAPHSSGVELVGTLQNANPRLTSVVISSRARERSSRISAPLRGVRYLAKPFGAQDLLRLIQPSLGEIPAPVHAVTD